MVVNNGFNYLIFAQEVYLDYNNFIDILHHRTKVIYRDDLDIFTNPSPPPSYAREENWTHADEFSIAIAENQYILRDEYLVNPFNEKNTADSIYLTYSSMNFESDYFNDKSLLKLQFHLSDTQHIRSIVVYDLITLVSEVSGFNDLFAIGLGFVFSYYTPVMLELSLIKHMSPVKLPDSLRPKKKRSRVRLEQMPDSLGKLEIVELVKQVSQYVKLRLNVYLVLSQQCMPRSCRSKKTNQLFALVDKGRERLETALEVKRVVQLQEEFQLLLKQVLSRQQLWLFRNQKKRFLSLDQGLLMDDASSGEE